MHYGCADRVPFLLLRVCGSCSVSSVAGVRIVFHFFYFIIISHSVRIPINNIYFIIMVLL